MGKSKHTEEILPLVNAGGEVIGSAPRSCCYERPGILHPVVHLHVINSFGEIYLQKRSLRKDLFPGRWDAAVGGHIIYGETLEGAIKREALKEIGITDFLPELLAVHTINTTYESEYVHVFMTRYDRSMRYNPEELADGRFWCLHEIEKNIGKGVFTPNFEQDPPLLKRGFMQR